MQLNVKVDVFSSPGLMSSMFSGLQSHQSNGPTHLLQDNFGEFDCIMNSMHIQHLIFDSLFDWTAKRYIFLKIFVTEIK